MKKTLLILSLTAFCTLQAQLHWESMILESNTWKYFSATNEPASNWHQPGFNDSSWSSGQGGLGFGDNDDKTIVPACNSLYMRTQISLPDENIIKDLILDIDYDDAFVLYINGVEAARSANITAVTPAYNASLTSDHEAKMYSGGSPERFQLKPASLMRGANTFALQIINNNISSSDLTARVYIHARINFGNLLYNNPPAWFQEPVDFNTSNLPVVFIQTNGASVTQNSKITADMKVLNNPTGYNTVTDTVFEFNGKIGIEIRGNTSAGFPKKSYSIETRNPDGSNLNVNLLGLPKENDWVFHGPYPDKSLMRNALAYHLGNLTGKWSPRTKFFELYLNNNYQGVYTLVEKIKIDKNRLNLAGLNPQDTIGDQVTGGYVLKIDRPEANDVDNVDYWISPYRAWTNLQQRVYFIFHDPDAEDMNNHQRNYIKNYITAFEDAMYSENYKDRITGYYPKIDLQSFVDYYIINELARNLDGYRISTFIHKDKDSKGGKMTMGPYWDYDICFGNANFFSAGNTSGWIIDGMGNADAYAMPFWWQKFRLDPYFNSHLKRRWNELKTKFINTGYLNKFIDSCAYEMRDAQIKNFRTWNILNTYVWPNNYVGGTYANELIYLKNWLRDRITWMDGQIQPIVDITLDNFDKELVPVELVTFPNPFTETVNFRFLMLSEGDFNLIINDLTGKTIYSHKEHLAAGMHNIPVNFSDYYHEKGIFTYRIMVDDILRNSGKLIRQ